MGISTFKFDLGAFANNKVALINIPIYPPKKWPIHITIILGLGHINLANFLTISTFSYFI